MVRISSRFTGGVPQTNTGLIDGLIDGRRPRALQSAPRALIAPLGTVTFNVYRHMTYRLLAVIFQSVWLLGMFNFTLLVLVCPPNVQ